MGSRVARHHALVHGDTRPGDALHVRHRRAAVDVRMMVAVLLDHAEDAHRRGVPRHAGRDRTRHDRRSVIIDGDVLAADRNHDDQRDLPAASAAPAWPGPSQRRCRCSRRSRCCCRCCADGRRSGTRRSCRRCNRIRRNRRSGRSRSRRTESRSIGRLRRAGEADEPDSRRRQPAALAARSRHHCNGKRTLATRRHSLRPHFQITARHSREPRKHETPCDTKA